MTLPSTLPASLAAALALGCRSADPAPRTAENATDRTAVVATALGARTDSFVTTLAKLGYSGSVLVETGDTVILSRGFGMADRRTREPNRAGVAFDIGSVAKVVTALTALKLVSEGMISLDQPVARYVLGLPPDKQGITVRQLLDHTSGLQTYHDETQERQTRAEAFSNIAKQQVRWNAGAQYGYSNSGYTLLAMLIEDVAREPFQDAVRRRVLLPASMSSTGWEGDSAGRTVPAAHGYFRDRERSAPAAGPAATWGILGAGGMYSTVTDLHQLSKALRRGLILDSATLALMPAAMGLDAESLSDRTLGWTAWREEGQPFFEKAGHTGSGGFTALLQIGPAARSTIVVLMNAEDGHYALGSATTIARALRRIVRGAADEAFIEGVEPAPLRARATFADGSGATVTFENVESDVAMARVEGQSVLDVVLAHDVSQRAAAARWNSLSAEVLSAAMSGATSVRPRVAAAAALLSARLAAGQSATPGESQVLGTVAEWILPSPGYVTFVRVGPPVSSRVLRLHWMSDSTFKSIGGGVYPSPYVARVVRTPGGVRLLSVAHGVFSPPLGGDPARVTELQLGALTLKKR